MYTINILSNTDFDKLPRSVTRGSYISDSLGFADPLTGNAYVRHTMSKDLNRYLIDHEFEELIELESAHQDEYGIRHKKLRQTVGALAEPLGGLAALSSGNPLFALGGSALRGGIGGEKRSFGGALKRGAIGGATAFAANQFLGSGNNLGTNFQNPFAGLLGKTAFAAGAPGGVGGSTAVTGPGGQLLSRGGPSGGGSLAQGAPGFFGSALSKLFGGGAGSLGAGAGGGGGFGASQALGVASIATGLAKGFPTVPELPGSIDALRAQIQGGGSALSQQARAKLSEILGGTFDPLTEEQITAALNQSKLQREDAIDRIRDVWRNIRPNSTESTDSALRDALARENARFDEQETNLVANLTAQAEQSFNQNQALAIQQSLGANQQDMLILSQLAQLDISQISAQLGLDVQQAQSFKDTFLQLGSAFLFPGEGQASPVTIQF